MAITTAPKPIFLSRVCGVQRRERRLAYFLVLGSIEVVVVVVVVAPFDPQRSHRPLKKQQNRRKESLHVHCLKMMYIVVNVDGKHCHLQSASKLKL